MGRSEEALAANDKCIVLQPENVEYHYHRALILERRGKLEEALLALDEVDRLEGDAVRATLQAVELLVDLNRIEEAKDRLAGLSESQAQDAGVLQAQAHLALIEGDVDGAERLFTDAIVLDPQDPALREDLCRVLISSKRFAQAEFLLRWLSEHPLTENRTDLQFLRASCFLELDQPVEARTLLLKLSEGDGSVDYDVWSRLVDVAVLLKDEHLLDRASARLLRLDTRRPEGYLARAWHLRQKGLTKDALAILEQAPSALDQNDTLMALKAALVRESLEGGG
jgi:tetratricopeptide (TPR) repeat protein